MPNGVPQQCPHIQECRNGCRGSSNMGEELVRVSMECRVERRGVEYGGCAGWTEGSLL